MLSHFLQHTVHALYLISVYFYVNDEPQVGHGENG